MAAGGQRADAALQLRTGRERAINRITMRQRQLYDRARFDLLRTRVLRAR
jgi:hypothetical protein